MKTTKKLSSVFYISIVLVAITVLLGAISPKEFGEVSGKINAWISTNLGWYYVTISTLFVFFCLFLIVSPIGKLKLGKPGDKPEFSTISWFSMLFSAYIYI